MVRKKLSFTTRYVLAFSVLMLFSSILLGIVILYQSVSTIRLMINKNMQYVVESAADLLDGDELAALTEDDVNGEAFRDIKERLIVFQNHEDIRYIYAVRQVGEGKFVFTVDPDPNKPAGFGEEIVVTKALIQAGQGTTAVDDTTMEDRWGDLYSAYSPVFDSKGKVAGIVGIDFDAEWYRTQIRTYTISITVITLVSVLVGGTLVFLISSRFRKRFKLLDTELSKLSTSVDQLMEAAGGSAGNVSPSAEGSTDDEIGQLTRKTRSIQQDMAVYEQLQKDQYYSDRITGLPNLNYLKQFGDDMIQRLWSENVTPAIIYFDLRSMVSYNREYGYARGDELLKLTAAVVRDAYPDAMVARGEGDHFIVISRFDDTIEKKARKIDETVRKKAFGRSSGIQCAAVRMQPELTMMEGVQRARGTLKMIGNDLNVICRFYSYEEDTEFQTDRYIVHHFEEAMNNGWIRVFYQPIVTTVTKEVSAMEALARWADPKRGLISPGVFIPVLSRFHLLHKLDLYMVEQICREFRIREETGLSGIPVSINFSAQDFDYIDAADMLEKTLKRYGISRDSIIVEITEQDLAQASDLFIEQLSRIHESGYRLWLDDFGSGYSSLNTFSQYHIDRIKFDMDLVKHLDDNNGTNRIIMKSITDMCRQLGIHTLAEGIETEEQYRFLEGIGCGMVQGFFFFRPQPVDEISRIGKNENKD